MGVYRGEGAVVWWEYIGERRGCSGVVEIYRGDAVVWWEYIGGMQWCGGSI